MPAEGADKRAYLQARFGDPAKFAAVHHRLIAMAADLGVTFDPDTPDRIPNTMNAPLVIHWASLEGRQAELVTALFHAYWQQGRDIGDLAVLAEVAEHRVVWISLLAQALTLMIGVTLGTASALALILF